MHFSLFETSLGDCGIAWRGEAVIATRLPDASSTTTERRLAERTAGTKADAPSVIQTVIQSIRALLAGDGTDLSGIVCDFADVDPFAQCVYDIARRIPSGQTSTYGAIALELGDKRRSREVGQALGRNPLPIIVPCHRVLGAGGRLTGFSAAGGAETKLKMLQIEGAQISGQDADEAPRLFDDLPMAVKPGG